MSCQLWRVMRTFTDEEKETISKLGMGSIIKFSRRCNFGIHFATKLNSDVLVTTDGFSLQEIDINNYTFLDISGMENRNIDPVLLAIRLEALKKIWHYDIVNSNCEHLVRYLADGKFVSEQSDNLDALEKFILRIGDGIRKVFARLGNNSSIDL